MKREAWSAQWRRLLGTWVALVGLMLLSLGIAYLPLPPAWKAAAGLLIAGIKALLVLWLFMRFGRQQRLARLVVAVALWTLVVMGGLSGVDYLTRRTEPAAVQLPQQLLQQRH